MARKTVGAFGFAPRSAWEPQAKAEAEAEAEAKYAEAQRVRGIRVLAARLKLRKAAKVDPGFAALMARVDALELALELALERAVEQIGELEDLATG